MLKKSTLGGQQGEGWEVGEGVGKGGRGECQHMCVCVSVYVGGEGEVLGGGGGAGDAGEQTDIKTTIDVLFVYTQM